MKKANFCIIGIEGEEAQIRGIEQNFNKIIEENFLKLRKDTSIHTEAHRIPSRKENSDVLS